MRHHLTSSYFAHIVHTLNVPENTVYSSKLVNAVKINSIQPKAIVTFAFECTGKVYSNNQNAHSERPLMRALSASRARWVSFRDSVTLPTRRKLFRRNDLVN